MVKRSKRYQEAVAQVDRERVYDMGEAIGVLKALPMAKFDEAVEVVVRLGIDPRKTDQLIRGAVSLPNGLGKTVKVVVFAEGDKAEAAKAAGADEVGSADLAKKIDGGWMDFDVVIASPDMMKHVGKLGRVLGPHGKMPSPKSGTVTADVAGAVEAFKAGKVEFRTDAGGSIQASVGRASFTPEAIEENLTTFLEHIASMRPSAVKGTYLRKVSLSTTMGPGLRVAYGE